MQQYVEFIGRHPYLCGAFALVLAVFIINELKNNAGSAKSLSILQATRLMNDPKTTVLDVRAHTEYKVAHLQGAKNIALSVLKQQIDNVCSDKNDAVLVYCNIGMNAKTAAKLLQGAGYTNVSLLKGGISAWQADNMPISK